ncbi:MAG: SDR family NAD(P)-dependent oxidoreductase [Cyanobacteria bacterium P01_G01_bin.19]
MIVAESVVLITGASSGIGAALAETLAIKHAKICLILVSRDRAKLEEVASKCIQHDAEVSVISGDFADLYQVQSLSKEAIACFGRVDILVNNAGYGQMGAIELIPLEAAQEQMAVNFHAPLILARELIPVMRSQGGGKIINVSSIGGRIPFPAAGMYSCSKFALEALSDVLRMELKAFNIKVSVVEPGPVITDFFKVAWQKVLETIPHYAQTTYAPIFENIEAVDKQLDLLGWSAEKTAKAIAKIIAKQNPKPRYILATGGNTLVFIMNKILPTWARDEFWRRFYGLHKIEPQK